MQIFQLNETFRMIDYSLFSNNVNFVEIGFEWLQTRLKLKDHVLGRSSAFLQNPHFLCGKDFGATKHLCENNNPTLDCFFLGGCTVRSPGS